ncbi:MAG: ATP-binding protein [Armatimonadota bacterium]|nr:ATP-binding protein [bacterium]
MGNRIEIRVPCKPEYVRTVRKLIAEFAESANMPPRAVEEIEIAASEAVTNIVRHAYKGCTRNPRMCVKCAQRKSGLIVEVIDNGNGFNAPPDNVVPDVDPNREGGLGITLIKCLMDRVNYVSKPDEGTRIRMLKSIQDLPHADPTK